jgi:hypothetical protein
MRDACFIFSASITENRSSKTEWCRIGYLAGFLGSLGLHEYKYWSEAFFIRNIHILGDIYQEGGLEIVAGVVFWMI